MIPDQQTRELGAEKSAWIPIAIQAMRYGIFIVILDQVSKNIFTRIPSDTISLPTAPILTIIQHHNYGAIGNLPIPLPIIISITVCILFFIARMFLEAARHRKIQATYALALIFGGALSNLYDRVTLGYVFDWILLFGRSIINLADISIVTGALWYLITLRKTTDDSTRPS